MTVYLIIIKQLLNYIYILMNKHIYLLIYLIKLNPNGMCSDEKNEFK